MEQISSKQLASLLFIVRVGLAIVVMPIIKQLHDDPDAWIVTILATFFGVPLFWFIVASALRHPHLTLVERLQAAFGRWFGGFLAFLFVLLFSANAFFILRLFAGLLTAQPMPETPTEAFATLMMVGAWYAGRHGPEVIARISEVLAPIILVSVLGVLLIATKDLSARNLLPVLGHGFDPVLRAALFPMAIHAEVLVITMLVPLVKDRQHLQKAVTSALVAANGLILSAVLVLLMFYNQPQARRLAYPLYDLARSVSVGEFLERFDPFFILVWAAVAYVKLAILVWAAAAGLAQIFGLKEMRALVTALVPIFIIGGLRASNGLAELMTFNLPQVFPWLVAPFLVVLPAMLDLVERIRGRRGSGA